MAAGPAVACSRCELPAETYVDGWLFLDPIPYCGEHAGRLLRELIRMGWTFPFALTPIEPRPQHR